MGNRQNFSPGGIGGNKLEDIRLLNGFFFLTHGVGAGHHLVAPIG